MGAGNRMIINPSHGPGSAKSTSIATDVANAKAKGILVLGYVYSSYGSRSPSAIKSEIDKGYFYR